MQSTAPISHDTFDSMPNQPIDHLYKQSLLIARRMVRPNNQSALDSAPQHSEQELVESVIARCLQALSQGSTSVDLEAMIHLLNEQTDQEYSAQTLTATLESTSWCFVGSADKAPTPALLTIENEMISLTKYAQLESECARRVVSRMQDKPQLPTVEQAQNVIEPLMGIGDGILSPQQVRALAAVVAHRFMVLTGGPGTGKTTVVVRMLETLRALANTTGKIPVIRIAAPTGKAAQRLQESIDASIGSLSQSAQEFFKQMSPACTVQSLLGQQYGALTSYKHSADNPLWGDVFVIDEVSMVPLDLMVMLLRCLPPHARLILVGDPYQLASVEAGTVISDIVEGMKLITDISTEHAHHRTNEAQSFLNALDDALSCQWVTMNASLAHPSSEQWESHARLRCAQGLVELTRAHRFGDNVGGLVQAIKAVGDVKVHSSQKALGSADTDPLTPTDACASTCADTDNTAIAHLDADKDFASTVHARKQNHQPQANSSADAQTDTVCCNNNHDMARAIQAVFAQTVRFDQVPTDSSECLLPCIYDTLISRHTHNPSLEEQLVMFYHKLENLMGAHKVAEALEALDDMRLLCANNQGRCGAQDANTRIAHLLHKINTKQPTNQYGERLGGVLMVTRNNQSLGISNGDTGLLGKTEDGLWHVYFPDGSDGIKQVPRSRIECITLAYAITIHKSQGSQYGHAIVHLAPHANSPLNVRELFYTAVSRAKKQVSIVGSSESIAHAAQTAVARASGLTSRLVHLFNNKGSV